MVEFKRKLGDEIIWMIFCLAVVLSFPGFRERRILWLLFWFILFAGVLIAHAKYRIQIDELGLTIRCFRKSSKVIPWSSIRTLLFYRIPVFNLPVFRLRIDKDGKPLTITIPNYVVNYLQLVQSIINHTQLQPPSRWMKFKDRNTCETLASRSRYSVYYLIIFLLVFWGYTAAFTSIIWDPTLLFILVIGCLIGMKQCLLLRYRNPQKASVLNIMLIIFYIVGIYTFDSMFIGNADRYYLLLPLTLTFLVVLIPIAAAKKISVKSISTSIIVGIIIFIGIYYGSQKVLSRITIPHTKIATITGMINDISWSPDGSKIILQSGEYDLDEKDTSNRVWGYTISVPGYTITSTKLDDGLFQFGWSPDSKYILMPILSSNTQHKFMELRLYTADLNSAQVIDHQTTINISQYVSYLQPERAWSPDGKLLVYQSPVPSNQKKGRKLILYNVATQQKDTLIELDSYLSEAFWMNTSTVRYLTYEAASSKPLERYYSVWDVDIIKRKPIKVFQASESWRSYQIVANNRYIAAFKLTTGTGMPEALYSMDSFQRIELSKLDSNHYTFHPQGDRILYIKSLGNFKDQLIEYNLNTKSSWTIPTPKGKITDCFYSSTEKYIVYTCILGFGSAIFALNSDGSRQYKITDQNIITAVFSEISRKSWACSPNGTQLVYPFVIYGPPIKNIIYLGTFK